MKSQNHVLVAILALGVIAMGQEPQEEPVRLEVIPGGVAVIDVDDLGVELVEPLDEVSGAFVLGVAGQDADEKTTGGKAKKQDDGKIVREIDLGDGRKLTIVITTEGFKHPEWKLFDGKLDRPFKIEMPEGDFKVWGVPGFDPHGFDMKYFGDEVTDHMHRALRAFDRAREEFIRAYHEHAKEHAKAPADRHPHAQKTEKGPERAARAIIGKRPPKVRGEMVVEPKPETAKPDVKVDVKPDFIKKHVTGDVQVLDVSPGAASKHAREVEELRKEIKDLKKIVRELKDEMQKQKGE